MNTNLVTHTNPYLRDPQKLVQGICRMVKSSSAVEGIYVNIDATMKKGGYQFSVTPQLPSAK